MTSAVIPVHNRADLLQTLLQSIALQDNPFADVIVVDDCSTDGAAGVAEASGCRVIRCEKRHGFAAAVNIGWRAAETPWVAILNSDVELAPDWHSHVFAAAADGGFATGKLLNAADRRLIDGTYDLVALSGCAWRAGSGQADTNDTETRRIAIAPATACLWSREALARLGGFDESFESYLEDVDLGLRALEAGIHGYYAPAAIATHRGSASFGQWNPSVVRLIARNQLRLIRKHFDRALYRECRWNILAGQLLWGVVAFRHGAGKAWLQGKIEGLRDFSPQGPSSEALRRFLCDSEQEIEGRARDSYWDLYFRCSSARHLRRIDT